MQLDELYVEGLVDVTELGSDYFQFDEARNELRGERTGIRYRLTDRVRVQVSRVDLDARKIDFRLVQEPSAKTLRARTTGPEVQPRARRPTRCPRARRAVSWRRCLAARRSPRNRSTRRWTA